MENKRALPRQKVKGILSDISTSGKACSECVVCDVSIKGIAISDIPSRFLDLCAPRKGCNFNAIVTSGSERVKVALSLRWIKPSVTSSMYTTAGFEVCRVENSWTNFVTKNTPLTKSGDVDDVWGKLDTKYMRC